ncbi:hypothetical protein [Nonomuraea sp. NPDC023979]|uniref:hypothetical protein n=1 Tax=Nonomuraea sp. NPDC023979 TaxID=3154796 RepID=UPI0033D6CD56
MTVDELVARYPAWQFYPLWWGVAAARKHLPTSEQFNEGYLYALIGSAPDDLARQLDRQPDCRLTTP